MKFPPKIRIVSSWYTLSKEKMEDDGKSNFNDSYIKINESLNDEKQARACNHEITHMILDEFHIDLPEKMEERVIRAIEYGQAGFAKDHQKLYQQLVKEMGNGR